VSNGWKGNSLKENNIHVGKGISRRFLSFTEICLSKSRQVHYEGEEIPVILGDVPKS
jgi:hypothetical protein